MTLYELENGDVFIHAKDKSKRPKRFVVHGNPVRNVGWGYKIRYCRNRNGELISKNCDLEVVKLGESIFKPKIEKMFNPKKINLVE